jgi:predicted nucleotidyltransferase
MLPSEALNKNREKILEVLASYPSLKNLRVFGSVARGEDTEKSDIDFLVDAQRGTTFIDLSGLEIDLQKLLGVPVHLTNSKAIRPQMKDKCLNEAILI